MSAASVGPAPPRPAPRCAMLWSKYINWELHHASRVLDHERRRVLRGPSVSVAWSRVMFIISSRALLFTPRVYIPSKGSKSQTCNQWLTMLNARIWGRNTQPCLQALSNLKSLCQCRHYCKQVFETNCLFYLKLKHSIVKIFNYRHFKGPSLTLCKEEGADTFSEYCIL